MTKLDVIVSVVPNPNLVHLKLLESELKMFIADNNPNVVDKTTRHIARKHGGQSLLGLSYITPKSLLMPLTL